MQSRDIACIGFPQRKKTFFLLSRKWTLDPNKYQKVMILGQVKGCMDLFGGFINVKDEFRVNSKGIRMCLSPTVDIEQKNMMFYYFYIIKWVRVLQSVELILYTLLFFIQYKERSMMSLLDCFLCN